ncbi:MAG: ATP-binding protein [Elainellaceae cyanobacterium]
MDITFRKIRDRLLIANLLVFALVLGGFGSVVRIIFVRNFSQQLTDRLITTGQGAAGNAEIEDGYLEVENEFLAQNLANQDQIIQWFDMDGNLKQKQGRDSLQSPLTLPPVNLQTANLSPIIEDIQINDHPVRAVTLPILSSGDRHIIGYVRVSQSLNEFQETITQLDVGLGLGIIMALALSGMGSLWLNRQAMQPIEESVQRLKQFTADASHELRSPLMAISSNVEVTLKYSTDISQDDRDVLSMVLSATDHMTQLTEDLLLLARTDKLAGIEQKRINMSDVLKHLVQLYQCQADARQITLGAKIEPRLELVGDEISLIRAFTNLIQNALCYTPPQGKIMIDARLINHQIQIAIEDTGVGIAPEHLEHIFERFWRADSSRSHENGGTGLGLSITQAIIQNHGGSIMVKSHRGLGSCFTVTLPSTATIHRHQP